MRRDPWSTAVKSGVRAQFPPKLSLNKVLNFAFKPKVKTGAEKLSIMLRISPEYLLMDIFRHSQLVIFSPSTISQTFFLQSLAGFLSKLIRSSRRRRLEVALDVCVWPLCAPGRPQNRKFPIYEWRVKSGKADWLKITKRVRWECSKIWTGRMHRSLAKYKGWRVF